MAQNPNDNAPKGSTTSQETGASQQGTARQQSATPQEPKVYSLYAISKGLKDAIAQKFGDKLIWIRAEIAEINFHRSGHAYLELADNEGGKVRAQARAMIWASSLEKIKQNLGADFPSILKKGSQLQCQVKVSFHLLYGLRIEIISVDSTFNLGQLEKRKQETLAKLKSLGLMQKNAGLALPLVVQKVALIGSPETSGYRDFVKQLLENEYGYRFRIDTFPTTVQGDHAAKQIVASLKKAGASDCQAIVLIRGGGSKLDLEVFNDFAVAQEIANSPLPVLTGIGHETDRAVADLVGHSELKTPTAVAAFLLDSVVHFESGMIDRFQKILRQSERILEVGKNDLERNLGRFRLASGENVQVRSTRLEKLAGRISRTVRFRLEKEASKQAIILSTITEKSRHILIREKPLELVGTANRIQQFSIDLLRQGKQDLQASRDRLRLVSKNSLRASKHQLEHLQLSLKLVHPDQVLKLGYGISKIDGNIIAPDQPIAIGAQLETDFINRTVISTVTEVKKKK